MFTNQSDFNIPDSLYKYSAITDYLKENLQKNQLYFQSPSLFNDPYEFIFKFEVKDDCYFDFLKHIYGDKHKEFFEKGKLKKEVLDYTRDYYFSIMRKQFGACCFSEDGNNDIMWAHYGGNHFGICIEFDSKISPINLFQKVQYVNHVFPLTINNTDNLEDQLTVKIGAAYLRKSLLWSYEKEWRLLSEAETILNYPLNAIKSITFGFFCEDEAKKMICDITSHLNIKYYEIVRCKNYYLTKRIPFGS